MHLLPFGLRLFSFYLGGITHNQFKAKITPYGFTVERSAGLTTQFGQAHNTTAVPTTTAETPQSKTVTRTTTTTSAVGHPRK